MRIARTSRRHRHVARASIFLIAAALVLGTAACNGDSYQLTVSSTVGGSVVAPAEEISTYDAGAAVDLVATADDGYKFQVWTGDTEDIADPDSASTTITMNGNYSITANFEKEDEPSPSLRLNEKGTAFFLLQRFA